MSGILLPRRFNILNVSVQSFDFLDDEIAVQYINLSRISDFTLYYHFILHVKTVIAEALQNVTPIPHVHFVIICEHSRPLSLETLSLRNNNLEF